jgi:PilZ domain
VNSAAKTKKRRYPRIGLPKGMHIAWQGRGLRTVARVVTLGLGGLFIDADKPPVVGEVIRVIFEVPGGDVRATAVVRDSQPGIGMGIEFSAMDPEPRARLVQLLRRLLGDSDPELIVPLSRPAGRSSQKAS